MAQISRQTTFTAGAKLAAADLESEFNELVNALNGTNNREVHVTYNNSDEPTLKLDNTGSGKPLSILVGGVEKLYVKQTTGQLQSTIATGTAPFVVASTTEVANLNAASVGGVAATALAQLAATTNTFDAGANTTILLQGGTTANIVTYDDDVGAVDGQYYRIRHSGQVVTWGGSSDGSTYDLMFRLNHASGTNGAAQISTDGGSNFYDIASENYVDAKLTTISFGAFYEGALATSTKQPRFIVPADIQNGDITKVYCTYQSGTVTGDSVITLTHYNAAGTSQATAPVTLLSTQTVGAAVATDITDMALSAGDQLGWTVTTASGHAEVTIWAQGTQEVI
jgi:hypothetical protein